MEADVKEQIDRINKKLESTLTIILEHFKETDERLKIEKDIAQIKGGSSGYRVYGRERGFERPCRAFLNQGML